MYAHFLFCTIPLRLKMYNLFNQDWKLSLVPTFETLGFASFSNFPHHWNSPRLVRLKKKPFRGDLSRTTVMPPFTFLPTVSHSTHLQVTLMCRDWRLENTIQDLKCSNVLWRSKCIQDVCSRTHTMIIGKYTEVWQQNKKHTLAVNICIKAIHTSNQKALSRLAVE